MCRVMKVRGLKKLNFLEDRDGHRYELRYIRDKEGREVDFAVVKEGVVVELIEAKYQDSNLSKSLNYYAEHLNPAQGATQVLSTKKTFSGKGKIKVQSVFEMFNPATLD